MSEGRDDRGLLPGRSRPPPSKRSTPVTGPDADYIVTRRKKARFLFLLTSSLLAPGPVIGGFFRF
jgi:hypothetical protein